MAAKKLLRFVGNAITEVFGVQASTGAANAGDIVSLDDSGRLDMSMMPVGMGADTAVIAASEALAAGDFVNIWNSTGANATVYFEGTNTQVSGQTAGPVFLQTTAGTAGATAPSAAGNVVQRLGIAISPTAINFESGVPVVLA